MKSRRARRACKRPLSRTQLEALEPRLLLSATFVDATAAMGLPTTTPSHYLHSGTVGDVNGDGYLDVFFGTWQGEGFNRLYVTNGSPVMTESLQPAINQDAGVAEDGRSSGSVFADFDNDGDLDLVVLQNNKSATGAVPNQLLRNDGNGNFTDVSSGSGIEAIRVAARNPFILDYNNDGWLDVLIQDDWFGDTDASHLMRNNGDMTFTDVTAAAGLPTSNFYGIGGAVGDINGDTYPDIEFSASMGSPSVPNNRVFINDRDGTFTEITSSLPINQYDSTPTGLPDGDTGWPYTTSSGSEDWVAGGAFGDIDGDGDIDMVIGQHFERSFAGVFRVSVRVYMNTGNDGSGNPQFTDITVPSGVLATGLYSKMPHVEIQDFDNDGRMDIWVADTMNLEGTDTATPYILYNTGNSGGVPHFVQTPGVDPTTTHEPFDAYSLPTNPRYLVGAPTADFNQDGKLDIFTVEAFQQLHYPAIYLNTTAAMPNYLDVQIHRPGASGNVYGIGATVQVYQAGHAGQSAYLLGTAVNEIANGYVSGRPAILHFGVPGCSTVDVVVKMPNGGTVYTIAGAATNRLLTVGGTAADVPPTAPDSLVAAAVSSTRIALFWADHSATESSFRIERSTDGMNWAEIAQTGPNTTGYTDINLTPCTDYYYRVRSYNFYGSSAPSAAGIATTQPGTAPAAPSLLSAAALSYRQVDLAWTDNSDNESGFVIERSPTGTGNWTQVAAAGANATSGSDSGLAALATYYYRARATNLYGDSCSNTVSVTMPAGTAPAAPSSPIAAAATPAQINLAWTDNSDDEAGFKIERSPDGSSGWTQVGAVGANVTTYSSTALSAGTGYYYRVRATNAHGDSSPSATASATTPQSLLSQDFQAGWPGTWTSLHLTATTGTLSVVTSPIAGDTTQAARYQHSTTSTSRDVGYINTADALYRDSEQVLMIAFGGATSGTSPGAGAVARLSTGASGTTLDTCYYVQVTTAGTTIYRMVDNGTPASLGTSATAVAWNAWYYLKFDVVQNGSATDLKAKVWAVGSAEPGWTVTASDTQVNALQNVTGRDGIYGYSNTTITKYSYCDNYSVAFLDAMAPTADVLDVTPDPRTSSVSSATIVFSEPVTGFNLADVALTRDGGGNLLTGSQTLTTTDNVTFTLGNLTSLTSLSGTYTLTLTAAGSGIIDAASNAIVANASDTRAEDLTAPTAVITAVSPDPRNSAVSSITVVFFEPVTGFNMADLSLTRGGGNLLTGSQTLTTTDNVTFTLGNLSGLTAAGGTYALTLTASGSGIIDAMGNALTSNASETWVNVTTVPQVSSMVINLGNAQRSAIKVLDFTFSEAVTVHAGDLTIYEYATDSPVDLSAAAFSYNGSTHVATWDLSGVTLDNSYYDATLAASGITDALGNHMAVDDVRQFLRYAGDADGDGYCDVSDLGIMGAMYDTGGNWWEMAGDFNCDGWVDVSDLGIMGGNYDTVLTPPGGGAPAAPMIAGGTSQQAAEAPAAAPAPDVAAPTISADLGGGTTVSLPADVATVIADSQATAKSAGLDGTVDLLTL